MARTTVAALLHSLLPVVLVACGGTVVFEEDGGGGLGGSGDGGGSPTSTAGVTVSSNGPATVGPTATAATSASGEPVSSVATVSAVVGTPAVGICGSGVTLFSGTFDSCLAESCCEAFDDCTRQGEDILGCQNCLDGFGGECRAALDCAEICLPSGPGCNSGIEVGDENTQACVDNACCAEELFCTSGGPRLDDCIECFDSGGGPRCDPFLGCFFDNCDASNGICTSGLTTGELDSDLCLSTNCCEEFVACTDDGNDAQACIDCLLEGGGALCDAAIACNDAFGCFDLDGGGGGGRNDDG